MPSPPLLARGSWRMLVRQAGRAAWNMSLDEALLEYAAESPATLRLYHWERPSASLGYRQKPPDWLERAAELGVDVVRRCSGGGTVLHSDDLTYAVLFPLEHPDVPAGREGSYAWVRERLVEGLRLAGLPVAPSRVESAAESVAARSSVCFAAPTGAEIDLHEVKLVGSAQRRTSWGVLQHGSIRLGNDRALYQALIGQEPERPRIETGVDVADVAHGILSAFESALEGRVVESALSSRELRRAEWRETQRRDAPLALLSLRRSPTRADSSRSEAPS